MTTPESVDVREAANAAVDSLLLHETFAAWFMPVIEKFLKERVTPAVLAAVTPVIRRQVAEETAEQQRRFWSFVDLNGDGGCWVWRAGKIKGYGQFHPTRETIARAHRWAYETLVGPIPDGLTLDHLCLNRACVNPLHLEPVTIGENNLRGTGPAAENKRKTQCPAGHPYDETNTWRDSRGKRYCRTCKRIANQDYAHRRKAAAAIARSHSTQPTEEETA